MIPAVFKVLDRSVAPALAVTATFASTGTAWAPSFGVTLRVGGGCGDGVAFAEVDGRPDDGDHLLFVSGRAVAKAHSHTAESKGRNLQVAISKFAFLH